MTRREEIISLLSEQPWTARDLALHFMVSTRDIEIDLEHIAKTVSRTMHKTLLVKPNRCLNCGFVFKHRSRTKEPKRCPSCHHERILPREYKIE